MAAARKVGCGRARSRRRAIAFATLAAAALAAAFAAAAAGGLRPNPADDRRLVGEPIERFRYDDANECREGTRKGTRALQRWLERNVRGEAWGINRCERLGSGYSVHAEGRALDWRLDAGVRRERRAARRLIRTLLATDSRGRDHALARRMGVQGLIFNCRQWYGGDGLGRYGYCFKPNGKRKRKLNRTAAHKDHIHIELNWRGARKKTSFWRSPLASE